jgi:hypothetical protein
VNSLIAPLVRRAILDLLEDVGGEQNDEVLALLLNGLGHRVARRDVADQISWMAANHKLVSFEELGPYIVTRILADGRDVATGRLVIEGISRHKTGD